VNSDGVVKTLLDRRLVKMLGRKEAPGRPLLYGTSNEFLQYFGLKDLSELPTLKEFQEIEVPEIPETVPDESEMQQEAAGEETEAVESQEEEGPDTVMSGNEQETEPDGTLNEEETIEDEPRIN
jgi:segregation and condensation protein B